MIADWNELYDISSPVARAAIVLLIVLGALVVQRVFVRMLRRAYWSRVERAAAASAMTELNRVKRQKTLVTLLESLVRYGVYGAAAVLSLGVITEGRAPAVLGASIVVLIGFGLQRMFGDIVAGVLLLFEGHFAVGDVVTIHPTDVTGTVEDFSLRTTALRTLGGDRVTFMNGSITSFTRWSYSQREFRIELLLADAAAGAALEAACADEVADAAALWLRSPRIEDVQPAADGRVRARLSAVVAPGHEHLVERFRAVVEAVLRDAVVGPVTAAAHHEPSYVAWRADVLLRDE